MCGGIAWPPERQRGTCSLDEKTAGAPKGVAAQQAPDIVYTAPLACLILLCCSILQELWEGRARGNTQQAGVRTSGHS